jgi:hypothetical protein
MFSVIVKLLSFVLSGLVLAAALPLGAQVSVWTYHNNNQRTGLNPSETILNLTNVTSTRFGKLFSQPVDGYVYAQPLYVPGVAIPGQGTHNVLFIATQHNTVYAFDADSAGAGGGLLWQTNLGPSAVTTVTGVFTNRNFGTRYNNNAYTDIMPEVGITGTPVIDLASGTLYVDVFTGEIGGGVTNYFHRLHALNITNGAERPYGPVVVTATAPGSGVDSVGGKLTFNHKQEIQRAALTLAGGILYVAYSGYADTDPYHGWIIGFNATNLLQLTNYVFNTTPNSTTAGFGANAGEGGVWMGGGGLCVDENTNLYFEVGNGIFTATNGSGGTEFGDSFIKLSTTNGLKLADYFTPYDQLALAAGDQDLGSGGMILLPDQPGTYPRLMLGAGKGAKIYLMNRDQLTTGDKHYNHTNSQDFVVQTNLGKIKASFSTPAYFNGRIYYATSGDNLRAIALSNGLMSGTGLLTNTARTFGFPGATAAISANGTNNGIVWALQKANPAVLVACNATNLTEIYTSSQASGNRDLLANSTKFAAPAVADGKVFVGNSNSISVFGLLAGTFSFSSVAYTVKETTTNVTVAVNRVGGTNGAVQVSYGTVAGGSAVAGVDYSNVSGTLNWADGESGTKSFSVPVLGNSLAQSNVTVNLALSNPTNAASALGVQFTSVLTINLSTPLLATPLAATPINFGQTLASSTLSGTFTNAAGASVPGTLAFVNPALLPKAGTTNVPVIFAPTDFTNYNNVTNTVGVTVNPITAAFTGLRSLTNTYPVTNIVLTGGLSGAGPVYPVNGEIVSASINSIAVNGTVTNSAGGFWINYNPPSLATNSTGGSPYTISYNYAGNAGAGLSSATDSSTRLTIVLSPVDSWKAAYFGTNASNPAIAGDSADPDHDGIVNLLAYAYGFNPLATNINPFVASIVGQKFLLRFPRNTSATDLTYLVQSSANLSLWSNLLTYTAATGWVTNQPTAGVSESASNGVPPSQYVNVTVTGSTNVTSGSTNQFLRLQIHR